MFDMIITGLINFFTVDEKSAYVILLAAGFISCIATWIHDVIAVGDFIRKKIKRIPLEYSTFDWVVLPIKACVVIFMPQVIYQFVLSFI